MIVADNGDIVRIVGTGGVDSGAFATFDYDVQGSAAESYGPLRIVPRGVRLLDYTAGGPSFRPDLFGGSLVAGCGWDAGGADEAHGESGDDVVYGGCGNDALFGDAEDDDLIGGWGHDFLIGWHRHRRPARRRRPHPHEPQQQHVRRVAARRRRAGARRDRPRPDRAARRAGRRRSTEAGALKKTAVLEPFNPQPGLAAGAPGDPGFDATHADDVLFGGLGGDFLHGGSGNDAISGAEALEESYAQLSGHGRRPGRPRPRRLPPPVQPR